LGATPSRTCPGCGREAPADARFSPACGARLEQAAADVRDERKVVSVVFVDLVGYTERAERLDPEDARALLASYWRDVRHELEQFGGTVEKFIGDAVVGLFGAPLVHEDDAERAVRAALSIRDWARDRSDLVVRAAVATGPALVRLGARVEEGEGMVVGDVVTTASRLQEHAPAGGVLVDERTHRATEAVIEYRPLEPVRARGKRSPVQAWEGLVAAPPGSHPLATTPFVGRRTELELLTLELARARSSGTMQLVTLVGAPGVGKSRLVLEVEAASRADTEPPVWWKGRALPYGDGVAYWALGESVKARAGISPADAVGPARRKLARLLDELLTDPAERRWVEPYVERLVGVAVNGRPGEEARLDTFAAWRRLVEAAAAERPLVLVLEDVHWADDGLLDFVEYLVEWAAPVPLLVLCTARPELFERRPAWGGGKPNALALSLSPLSDDETAALLRNALGREPPPEALAELLARVGGNPLYAEQYARMLTERDVEAAELPLPDSVQGIIAARLDRLPAEEKLLLQDAAVAGRGFSTEVVAAIGGGSAEAAVPVLHRLERKDLVRRAATPGRAADLEYAFAHRLVRDVAYDEIARAARADKHLRAAAWLEERGRPDDTAELVAHHYLEARSCLPGVAHDMDLDRRTREALVRAGDRALALDSFGAAARYYTRALELWPDGDPARARVLLRLGHAQSVSEGGGEAVLLEARDALLAADDSDCAAEAEALLSEIHWYRGDRARAKEHLDRAVRLVGDAEPSHSKARVLARLARWRMLAGDYPGSIAVGREAQALAEQLGLETLVADTLNSIGSARVRSGDAAGIGDVERAIELAPNTHTAVVARNNLSALYADLGDTERSRTSAAEATRAAEILGDRSYLDWARASEVDRAWTDGRFDEALAGADAFFASRRGRPHYLDASVHMAKASVFEARDEIEAALAECAEGERCARSAADPQVLLPALVGCALVELADGSTERAGELVSEVLRVSAGTGGLAPQLSIPLAVVLTALDRTKELEEYLAEARGPSRWLDAARAFAAGDFDRAVEVCEDIGEPWVTACVRLQAARWLLEAGRPDEARAHLDPVFDYYRSAGAVRWLREAEQLAGAAAAAPV